MPSFTSTVQRRPNELVDVLRTDFQHRNEPNFAWKSAVSCTLGLAGLVGSWPMSVIRLDADADRVRDVSGAAYHLTRNGNPRLTGDDLRFFIDLDGTGDYLDRVAGAASWASILGTDAHIGATLRGLTMGCWVKFDATPVADDYIMAKMTAAAENYSYWLVGHNTGVLRGGVSVDGTAQATQTHSTTIDTDWHFAAMRFVPSTTVDIWWDDEMESNAAAIPASIFDGTADFTIGSRDAGDSEMAGRVSLAWLCQCALPDAVLFSLWHQQRAMFGRG